MYSLQLITSEELMYLLIDLELLLTEERSIFLGWKSKGRYPGYTILP